jgi:ComF family protein
MWFRDFLSIVYPPCCEACRGALLRHEKFLCNQCRIALPRSNYHLQSSNPLLSAFFGRIPLQHAFSFYTYEKSGRVQRLVHSIKYSGGKETAEFLGRLYADDLRASGNAFYVDMVVPIPLHKKKLKARGFNQSEYFAKGLAEGLDRPMETGVLERVKETSTQTRKKKFERWENVEGIFQLRDIKAMENKHVLLVDDVITTGATLEAAWQAIKKAEGVALSVASIAFAARASGY